ncbi:hypothetical protein CQW23_35213 [Capsicum baccatum]|uniref:DUF7751 domain-containing protein n=1 Tax=Capsicum baccatum TaxID=33114 RepID=A0A2G2UWN7_CAPBA|nr:hypothetical protein CQW23_35213 [Capsicum baccatum]
MNFLQVSPFNDVVPFDCMSFSRRGPAFGIRRKIVLSFKDSPSAKVGVQFDKPIPRGINLGGLCEDAHGFFCKVDELHLEGSGQDDLENLLVNTLFEDSFGKMQDKGKQVASTNKFLTKLFPNKVVIHMPQLNYWVLEGAEKVVGWALSHHLMRNTQVDVDMRLVLSPVSIQYGLELLQAKQNDTKSLKKSLKCEVLNDHFFGDRLLRDVVEEL